MNYSSPYNAILLGAARGQCESAVAVVNQNDNNVQQRIKTVIRHNKWDREV